LRVPGVEVPATGGDQRIGFAIIGAQKASTTFLARTIREHPDAYMPDQEFRTFEDPEYGSIHGRMLAGLFGRSRGRLVGIKRPDYLAIPGVAHRLREHNPAMKLIVVTRPRIPRLISAYFFYIKFGFLPLLPLEDGVRRILDDAAFPRRYPRAPEIVEYGFYGRQLAHYLQLFPAENVFVLSQDEISEDSGGVRRRLYAFLDLRDLPGTREPRLPSWRRNLGIYDLRRLRFLRYRNEHCLHYIDGGRKYCRKPGLGPRTLGAAILGFDHFVLRHVWRVPAPELPSPLRQRLEELYAPDDEALADCVARIGKAADDSRTAAVPAANLTEG
jgi:hypothetical protein